MLRVLPLAAKTAALRGRDRRETSRAHWNSRVMLEKFFLVTNEEEEKWTFPRATSCHSNFKRS